MTARQVMVVVVAGLLAVALTVGTVVSIVRGAGCQIGHGSPLAGAGCVDGSGPP